ncbi:MAG: AraC family transcriptional regulator [Chitinophagaceae bacterium]|nr:MAG: AraC family transcriptional regulator [Chitinophagaceae bacterium]
MKVLQFTIPVPINQTIMSQHELLPYFYPHLHRHEEIQLTWIRKGEGTLVADNNMHSFGPNEIYWLGANQPHLFKSDPSYFLPKSKKVIQALTIFFNPSGPLSPMFDLPELKPVRKFINSHESGFVLPQSHVAEIAHLMLEVSNKTGLEQMMQFLEIFRKLMGYDKLLPLSASSQVRQFSEHEGLRMARIYNYIMQHYNKPVTLEEVAGQAHMTPQAFCRYFKKHTRHTLFSFLNEVRINEACKQLTEGAYESISAIAYNCGFNSITNFNRVFKTTTGSSPSEYINSYLHNVQEKRAGQ